jgi:ABC-type antimicrobial peptide transport system permease subunit
LLIILAMALGVAAVVVLTALGDGAQAICHQPVFFHRHQFAGRITGARGNFGFILSVPCSAKRRAI